MTTSYRIIRTGYDIRFPTYGIGIEFKGYVYTADELHEEIWLVNVEMRRCCLTKREQKDSLKLIAQYEELLSALRSAGG